MRQNDRDFSEIYRWLNPAMASITGKKRLGAKGSSEWSRLADSHLALPGLDYEMVKSFPINTAKCRYFHKIFCGNLWLTMFVFFRGFRWQMAQAAGPPLSSEDSNGSCVVHPRWCHRCFGSNSQSHASISQLHFSHSCRVAARLWCSTVLQSHNLHACYTPPSGFLKK